MGDLCAVPFWSQPPGGSGGGSGDFVGPASSTDNAAVRFDGTTGKLAQNSILSIADTDALTTPALALGTDLNTGVSWVGGADKLSLVAGGKEALRVNTATSAVNYLNLTPSAAAAPIILAGAGTDTDIGIRLAPKGAGQVEIPFGTSGAPGIAFTTALTRGIYGANGGLHFSIATSNTFGVTSTGPVINSSGVCGFSNGSPDAGAVTVAFSRVADGVVALGTGANGNTAGTLHLANIKLTAGNTTGAGTALLSTNCPAVTASAPFTWFTVITSDGSTGFIPVWK